MLDHALTRRASAARVLRACVLARSRGSRPKAGGRAASGLRRERPALAQIRALRAKHGAQLEEWWRQSFGFRFDCLTRSEARYLENTADADTIRSRVAAAGSAGGPWAAQDALSDPLLRDSPGYSPPEGPTTTEMALARSAAPWCVQTASRCRNQGPRKSTALAYHALTADRISKRGRA
jgi:hypothetical protein